MEQDSSCSRYLLHSSKSWEPHEKMSNISFYSKSFLQRRHNVKVEPIYKDEDDRHTGSSATGVQPFNCTTYNNSFTHTSNLTKHMRLHSDEKLFNCTYWCAII